LHDSYVQATLKAEKEGVAFATIGLSSQLAEQRGLNEDLSCYFSAGWDFYCFDDMEMILEGRCATARSAGWLPLARIAESHLQASPIAAPLTLQKTPSPALFDPEDE